VGLTIAPKFRTLVGLTQEQDQLPVPILCSRCGEEIKKQKEDGRLTGFIENLGEA